MNNQQQVSAISSQILTLPGIGSLLKRSWQVYKARIGTFLGILVLPLILLIPFGVSFFLIIEEKLFWLGLPLFIISLLALVIISIWSQVALLFAIKEREEKIGIRESYKKAWSKILSFVWISILKLFIVLGGFFLLIIPGIIFAVWFSLATYILVSENLKGFSALIRSKQYIAGYWWKVFWRFLVIGIIAILIIFGITLPILFLVSEIVNNIISLIINLFLTPFLIIYSFLIYEDLRKLKSEISFERPKKGTKIKYVLVGVFGFLLILILPIIVLIFLKGVKIKAQEARIMATMSQIRSSIEMIYFETGSYDGINCSHKELASLCQDIQNQVYKEPTIHTSRDSYCLYTKLFIRKYFCLDSRLLPSKPITTFPGGKGYCDGLTFICPDK